MSERTKLLHALKRLEREKDRFGVALVEVAKNNGPLSGRLRKRIIANAFGVTVDSLEAGLDDMAQLARADVEVRASR